MVKEALQRLPVALKELYNEVYGRISAKTEGELLVAKRALSWLLCAFEQPDSHNLLIAVSPSPEVSIKADELLDLCRDLVVLNEGSNSFKLAHLSVREYLEDHKDYKDGQAHEVITKYCINSLKGKDQQGDLVPYASLYWMDHYRSSPQTKDAVLAGWIKTFFNKKGDNPTFKSWAKLARDSGNDVPWGSDLRRRLDDANYEPLAVVCVFGLQDALDQWKDTPKEYSYFQDTMVVHLAMKWGSVEVAHSLLLTGANPVLDEYGFAPPFWAALFGQQSILEMLKECPGGLDVQDKMEWTALHWMVLLGNIKGVKILLKLGGRSNIADKDKWTPMHWAAFLHRETEVEELISIANILEAKDNSGWTPFQWARFLGYGDIEERMLRSGAKCSFDGDVATSTMLQEVWMPWELS